MPSQLSRSAWSVIEWVTIRPNSIPKFSRLPFRITNISKISQIPKISEISKKFALMFGKSCPLGRAILEISEILEIRSEKFPKFSKVRPYVLENPVP